MNFRITGLPLDPFTPLFALSEAALLARGARRQISPGSYPCRVTLVDAPAGEACILLHHVHHAAPASPYRAGGPIYVREAARDTFDRVNSVPEVLRKRLLSLRAYDSAGMMLAGEVVDGSDVETIIACLLADPAIATIHAHNAKRGCYAARITRA